jgi:flagellar hook-basal body complex protein FliE
MTFIPNINSIPITGATNGASGIALPPNNRVEALQPDSTPGIGGTSGPSFKDYLLESIKQVNSMQQDADQAVETLFTGGDVNPAEVLTAVQKADLAFRMVMQIRNKLVAAYEDIQNIRI